jgi:hypothetical protein
VDSPVKRKGDGVHGTFFPTARIRFALPKPRRIGAGAKFFFRTGSPHSFEAGDTDRTVAQVNLAAFGIGPGLVSVVGGTGGLITEVRRVASDTTLFGPWSVKVVNELDRCSKDAQDMLLTYLGRMKPGDAFLGTTNLDVTSLTERFQTRFQPVRLQPPENEVLAAFLAQCWGAPIGITRQIAAGAMGNVRTAMADLEMWLGDRPTERRALPPGENVVVEVRLWS